MNENTSLLLLIVAIMLCCLSTCGEPDILDGLIKRANQTECVQVKKP